MDFKYLHLTRDRHIALVEIDRPPVNALNTELVTELEEMFKNLESDGDIFTVILTGSGKAFVAGADISEMKDMTVAEAESFSTKGQNAMDAIAHSSKPVIAAVNGFALGGGCEIALACDIRLAVPEAKLGQPEVKLGVVPGFGGTQRLPRIVGPGKAKELIFSGKMLKAKKALKVGLVDRIVEIPSELIPQAKELATDICNNGYIAVSSAKKLINDGLNVPLDAGLKLERSAFSELFSTADQKEGMNAFLEKRKPKFKNQKQI